MSDPLLMVVLARTGGGSAELDAVPELSVYLFGLDIVTGSSSSRCVSPDSVSAFSIQSGPPNLVAG